MKKKSLRLIMAFVLSVGILGIAAIRTTYAWCTCAMVCNNNCQFHCEECGLLDGSCYRQAVECCQGAAKATGDTGPCPQGGGES